MGTEDITSERYRLGRLPPDEPLPSASDLDKVPTRWPRWGELDLAGRVDLVRQMSNAHCEETDELSKGLQTLRERFGTLQHQVAEWMTKVAERGAVESVVKDLVTRVDELQHQVVELQGYRQSATCAHDRCPGTRSRLDELSSKLAELQRAPRTAELVAMLRANGVTRYRSGDLEIELSPDLDRAEQRKQFAAELSINDNEPWPGAFEQLASAAKAAGWTSSNDLTDEFTTEQKSRYDADRASGQHIEDDETGRKFLTFVDPSRQRPQWDAEELAKERAVDPAPNDDEPSVQIDREELARLRAEQLQRRSGE